MLPLIPHAEILNSRDRTHFFVPMKDRIARGGRLKFKQSRLIEIYRFILLHHSVGPENYPSTK
jgi:hypothetical protein